MKLDDVFRTIKLHGLPINKIDRKAFASISAGELCDIIERAYDAGREERESEHAELIAANPLEVKVPT